MLTKFNSYILVIIITLPLCSEPKYNGYIGGWPKNKLQNFENASNLNPDCPGDIGCVCEIDNDCSNDNCYKIPRGSYCFPASGDYFPDFKGFDQFNDMVSIYDFSMQNKYILVEMAADWCSPCHMLSNWITYNDDEITMQSWWKQEYEIIPDLINNNDIYFITVLYENEFKDNATWETTHEWYSNYPNDNIPIIADENKDLHTWLKPAGIPAITLLDQNMKILAYTNRGLNAAFDKLIETYKKSSDDK